MKHLPWLGVICLGCATHDADKLTSDQARHRLKAQAQVVADAVLAKDYAKIVDMTHLLVVKGFGGREKMIEFLGTSMDALESKGFSIRSVDLGNPTDLAEGGGDLFGIVPVSMKWIVKGKPRPDETYLIGVSQTGGRSWFFLDGNQFDEVKVRILFPDFPWSIRLPKVEPFVHPDDDD